MTRAPQASPASVGFPLLVAAAVMAAMLAASFLAAGPARAQAAGGNMDQLRFKVEGLPDLVLPRMDPARGRVYFATRACVVCHSVNGVGGEAASALDYMNGRGELAPLDFVSRMWRGGASMLALQESLFGEAVDLTAEEIADIMAFLGDAEEMKRFSENDIPGYVRDFMAGRAGARR